MVKRMLIDATHPEETRVVVVNGTKLEEFDFETSTKKQLKGNIYLAKVIRIEPSLQAAFVDYGGNRHGFLAFSEIHPDYYQIPVADREALLAEQERRARQSEEQQESGGGRRWRNRRNERNRRPEADQAADQANAAGAGDDSETALAETEGHDLVAEPGDSGFDGSQVVPTPDEAILANDAQNEWRDEDRDAAPADASSEHRHDELAEADRTDETARRHAEARIDWPVRRDADADGARHDEDRDHDQAPAAETVEMHEMPPERDDRGAGFAEAVEHHEDGSDERRDYRDEPHDQHSHDHDHDDHHHDHELHDGMTAQEARSFDEPVDGAGEIGDDRGTSEAADLAVGLAGEEAREETNVETVGGEDLGEEERPRRSQSLRNYKIQEVIKRRQILLVQVVKEERGNKGAALTTYLSLAGRYCVLMPNAGRGGGISRKISNPADRKRMKEMLSELEVPSGMGVILRTAGLERSKAEIKRDYDYLMRLWDTIREVTLKSTAPALIYEEGNLIKRSIRDLYNKDIEDIAIEGDDGYRAAKDFMRQLMPSHAKKVQLYNDQTPLFHRYQVETQLDAMHSPVVQLRSGGYIVINPTEALVAIDVNSGRSTKERNIEETALRTNVEAAEEIARQLRLRDLAGLIVIDFIDMEDQRHQQQVERRLKEAMRSDRARIQIGRISAFGLLELSRQRLRPSLLEISTEICPHCEGTGRVRSTESTVLHVLRGIEEEGIRRRAAEIRVAVPTAVALYLLNQKRGALSEIEQRYGLRVFVDGDESLIPPHYKLERIRSRPADQAPVPLSMASAAYNTEEPVEEEIDEDAVADIATGEDAAGSQGGEETGPDGRRRRRRRRRRRPEDNGAVGELPGMGDQPNVLGHDMVPEANAGDMPATEEFEGDEDESTDATDVAADGATAEDGEPNRRRRRRGRRGGRRRRHGEREGGEREGGDREGGDLDHAAPNHDEAPKSIDDHDPAHAHATREADHSVGSDQQAHQPAVPAEEMPRTAHNQPAPASEPVHAASVLNAQATTADEPTTPSEPAVEANETPAGPPRRGWWQRLTTRE